MCFIFVAATPNRLDILPYLDAASTPLQIQNLSKSTHPRLLTGCSASPEMPCVPNDSLWAIFDLLWYFLKCHELMVSHNDTA